MSILTATLFLALVVGLGHCNCLNNFAGSFYSMMNRELQSHAFQRTTVSSAVICGRDCSMDKQCKSFNYHAGNHLCELNNQTRIHTPIGLSVKQGSVYYDGNHDSSCRRLLRAGIVKSGIYTIYSAGMAEGLQVYCDMETDGGGWIVFQRRQDGSVDFYRNWTDYQSGFGNLSDEFWLGNEALRILTGTGQWQLRVDLWDWENNTAWTEYGEFRITSQNYTVHIDSSTFRGTAGDSLLQSQCKDQPFSTKDRDNDESESHIAKSEKGGWWFCYSFVSNLNAVYYNQGIQTYDEGIVWYAWKFRYEKLKKCSMMIREIE